jgi:arsenite/tail-anchored protein-transporting ATPase
MRILFFTGKGGVGKSTMAAASAWQLSQQHRVLIVSLDPAHNLGDIFGVRLKNKQLCFRNNLWLQEIDVKKLARDYLTREIDVLSQTYKYLRALNLDSYFNVLKYSPGIEEYALLTGIEETIRQEKKFDYIIFDTPPTGLTLRFLALPQVTITWIDRLQQIRRQILERRHTISKIRGPLPEGGKNPEVRLKYDETTDDIMNRLKELNQNYTDLNNTLQGEGCSIILVFNPDLLSLRESERLIEGLKDLKLPLRLLINNKVTEENMAMAGQVEKSIQTMSGEMPLQRVSLARDLYSGHKEMLYDIAEDLTYHLIKGR